MKRAHYMPNNCPMIEYTGDGAPVGRCWFYIGKEGVCPRHGKIEDLDSGEAADADE